jgi:hypothetical protein
MNAGNDQKLEPDSSPYLGDVMEAADRKIKDYLLRQRLSLWHPISTAPDNHDLELTVLDGGSSVVFPFRAGERIPVSGSIPIYEQASTSSRSNGVRGKKQKRRNHGPTTKAIFLTPSKISSGGATHE